MASPVPVDVLPAFAMATPAFPSPEPCVDKPRTNILFLLHRFSYVSHPFQTLNLNIGLLTTLRRDMCANDRNPASPTHSGNVEIRGVQGARLLTMT